MKKCDRKVIWVIGEKGNEEKSFFQQKIFGRSMDIQKFVKRN